MKIKLILISLALFLFVSISAINTLKDYTSDNQAIRNIILVKTTLERLKYLDKVITQVQRERGNTSLYYDNKSDKYLSLRARQRVQTNNVIKEVSSFVHIETSLATRYNLIQNIDNSKIEKFDAFIGYTQIIAQLFIQLERLIDNTNNTKIKNSLVNYYYLNLIQESLGQQRALISGILNSKSISDDEYKEIVILNRQVMRNYNNIKDKIVLKFPTDDECLKQTLSIIQITEDKKIQNIKLQPFEWFKLSTCAVDTVRKSVLEEIKSCEHIIEVSMKEAKNKALNRNILWFLGIAILIFTFITSIKLSRRLINEQKVLQSYKNVIDNNANSIVSRTDKRGIITYVNDTFCKISKYSREELIGKPHSIIRDKDIPKEVFKELWDTIESGKTWNAVVKNRAKDGSPYWVHASISPIYNYGEIVEYIALRHNITDMVLLNQEVESTQRELIYRMGASVESRSKESGNHVRRVAHYSKELALLAGLSEKESEVIFIASTMHDMGKIAIPDAILLKAGKLDKDEFKIMKTHSTIGYKLLAGSSLPILKMASTIAHEHHEHHNGRGYPRQLKEDEISLPAKIVAIVDVFDALISDRVYKKAWELSRVINLIKEESGKQFDPILAKLFLDNIEKFMIIKHKYEDIC